ncbi:MAG: hypothetical protein ACR2NO_06355 [Chloroflexota bacterium]
MRGTNRNDSLFGKYDLSAVIRNQEAQMLKEIDGIEANRLLNTSVEDLADYFTAKYSLDVPTLKVDQVQADQEDVDMDISHDQNRFIVDRSNPFYIKGTQVTFFVPYEGDKDLFGCRPSTYTISGTPRPAISENELALTYTRTDHDAAAVKAEFDGEMATIQQYLGWISADCAQFNSTVRDKAKARIEARREKLLKDAGMAASLGIPLRRRDGAPQTYVAPTVRRRLPVSMPPASAGTFVPEPTLEVAEYEHILSVIGSMVLVMERSPKAFAGMDEESLRQHFLVQLNGQYDGQASGETFNYEGKTDILIRVGGKNIFVAECKFWRGPEKLREALDQLLGYATWRDSKLALLIFNRNKNFSATLEKIPDVVKGHPSFKRELAYKSESGFRYVLSHRDDARRELTLTVLAFDVPG